MWVRSILLKNSNRQLRSACFEGWGRLVLGQGVESNMSLHNKMLVACILAIKHGIQSFERLQIGRAHV